MERKILKLLLSKSNYIKIRNIITPNDFTPLAKDVLAYIDSYFKNDDSSSHIDIQLLEKNLELSLSPKFKDTAKALVEGIVEEDVSEINLIELLVKLKKSSVGSQLSTKLLNGSDDKEIDKLIIDYQELSDKINSLVDESKVYNNIPIKEVLTVLEGKNRIPLMPKALNERLKGGVLRGQNILIFARPEMGKTLFAINLIRGLLVKGYKVLYMGNEDPCSAILPRILSRILEMPTEAIDPANPKTENILLSRGYAKLYAEDIMPGTWPHIRKRVEQIRPDVVVVDQIRHIYCGSMTKVEQMERVTIEARNLAKTYNLVMIGITQAGESAEGKLSLEMSDVDFSNTGMQGAVDLMIGIGANEDFMKQNRRMITLPKNKVGGQHDFFPVQYIIPINKVESL